jgi:pyruvate,water dikinase
LFSRTFLDGRSPRPAGSFNYAVVTEDYLNLNSRVEYHFAMLDTVCGASPMDNYIRFRFKGGGTGHERSRRRAIFLCKVLEANGFAATAVADLVTASLVGAAQPAIEQRLVMMGRLLGFSRLLDAVMDDDQTPQRLAEAFLAGRYDQRMVAPA